jgi:hypothetical protein
VGWLPPAPAEVEVGTEITPHPVLPVPAVWQTTTVVGLLTTEMGWGISVTEIVRETLVWPAWVANANVPATSPQPSRPTIRARRRRSPCLFAKSRLATEVPNLSAISRTA